MKISTATEIKWGKLYLKVINVILFRVRNTSKL